MKANDVTGGRLKSTFLRQKRKLQNRVDINDKYRWRHDLVSNDTNLKNVKDM